jgi:NAD(P)-dependent dehydrogenase (short-subunit alcohol dehydrogenase family)
MDLGLKGKRVILTGGSRGIGRASLEIFAAEGADVAFFSRRADQVAEAAASLAKHGNKVFAKTFEMGDAEAYKAWLVRAAEALGGVDIFVHNVSSSGAGAGSDWQVTFNLDILGAVAGCEALLPYLEKSHSGSVIFMSSTAATETFFAPNAFNAFKAALMTYSKQLSQAWGPKGIRVNTVTPGPIVFPGGNWTKIEAARPEIYEATKAKTVFNRLGTAEEVARSVVFLASPASSFTTGANLVIDGGYTKRVQF